MPLRTPLRLVQYGTHPLHRAMKTGYLDIKAFLSIDTAVSAQTKTDHTALKDALADKPIVLVGLMGAGKTSVGRRLANDLGRTFLDADHEIEVAAGRPVSDIFKDFGEASFREGERRVILRILSEDSHIVLATGGGAFVDEDIRKAVLDKAVSIWLNADVDVLVERTGRRKTRPLLKTGDPKQILTKLAAERTPFYSQANIHVQSGRGPATTVVRAALKALADWPNGQAAQ
ncbi:MAG: shikimate kinase [Sphingomonadales bacterium]